VTADQSRHDELVLPVLLAEARRTYGAAIRSALDAAGFEDMPRAGARVVGGLARYGSTQQSDVAVTHTISKQAVSQLIDTLVARGYIARLPDETDRRRLVVALTERGAAAAEEIRTAVEAVDGEFERAVGADDVARVRAALGVLVELRRSDANG
jgi:DNA-binding MarR family transcriptional regulator